MVVTWKASYIIDEITEMRVECLALWRVLYITNRDIVPELSNVEWQSIKTRFDDLRKCLGLLGFWYQGGDCFELTDGTDLL